MNTIMIERSAALITVLALALSTLPAATQSSEVNDGHHHHYKLVDMGTFGGPSSYFNETAPFVSASGDIANGNLALGASATLIPTTPTSNPGICPTSVPFVFRAFKWQAGAVTDLGALPGSTNCSLALANNTKGEIVGSSENGEIDPLVGGNESRAVLWKDNQMTDLGTLGGFEATAGGITNRGQVVGTTTNSIPDPYACFGAGAQCRAFLWQDGTMKDLGTLGGPDALGFLINEQGQASGVSNTGSTPNSSPWCPLPLNTAPFLWENGKMRNLGSLGGDCGLAVALNNRGQIVGYSTLAGDAIAHPFLWPGSKGKMRDLGTLGGSFGIANAINERGDVVGYSSIQGEESEFAFLWRGGVLSNLGSLNGDPCSSANAINSKGQVVGVSTATCDYSVGRKGFLWEHGSMVNLNALIPPDSGIQLTLAETINDRGEIAVNGTPSGCDVEEECGHAVLLIPCDENHLNIAGCDYSMVDASITIAQTTPVVCDASPSRLSHSPMRRMNRYRFPGLGAPRPN